MTTVVVSYDPEMLSVGPVIFGSICASANRQLLLVLLLGKKVQCPFLIVFERYVQCWEKLNRNKFKGPAWSYFVRIPVYMLYTLVTETALCVQAFVEMVANKMQRLMDVLANGVPMNGGMLRCHLLKEHALRSPVHTHARTHAHLYTSSSVLHSFNAIQENFYSTNNKFFMALH